MKTVLVALLIIAASVCCFGQESYEFKTCSGSDSAQSKLNKCASDEAARVDLVRLKTYQQIAERFRENAIALAKLKEEEAAWMRFRDSYVALVYPAEDKQAEYGSMYPMEVDLLIAQLTRAHIKALQAILEDDK